MSAGVAGAQALETRLAGGDAAIVPYLTGGYPPRLGDWTRPHPRR